MQKNILYLRIHRMRFVCDFSAFQSHSNLPILLYLQAISSLCRCDSTFFLFSHGLFPSRIEDSESCNAAVFFKFIIEEAFYLIMWFFLIPFQGKKIIRFFSGSPSRKSQQSRFSNPEPLEVPLHTTEASSNSSGKKDKKLFYINQ